MGNLIVQNIGTDHLYLNGIPIVEARISISDIYKKVARITSLAVAADPYFAQMPSAQKFFSESHGEGDRITKDFLEDGAGDILPVFQSLQRLIPKGEYSTKAVEYNFQDQTSDILWNNPGVGEIFVNSINVKCNSGAATVTIYVDGIPVETADLPDSGDMTYSIVGNARNNYPAGIVEVRITNNSSIHFDATINTTEYNGIEWKQALAFIDDIKYPITRDDILISNIKNSFIWRNIAAVDVYGITLKRNTGSADVTITASDGTTIQNTLDSGTMGLDFQKSNTNIGSISVVIENETDDFTYDIIVNTAMIEILPSPRFEFDSSWNPDEIIYRWQNMDTRSEDRKLDYTANTLKDIRIDTNAYDNVMKYLGDALQDYVLMEFYKTIGHAEKYASYARSYESNRQYVAFWVKSDTSLQTQYHYAGV